MQQAAPPGWYADPYDPSRERVWNGAAWTNETRAVATATSVYTGPRPSPARAWAPWVVVTSSVTAALAAAQCVLNLVERHYQQRRLSASPPSAAQIRHTLDLIQTTRTLSLLSATAFLVVAVVWSFKRRPRARLKAEGESSVEAALWRVAPIVYAVFWAALVIGVIASLSASSAVHPGMTIGEFTSYRTRLALSAGARTIMWLCWIPLVVMATKAQARREASAGAALPWTESRTHAG
jgi:uncharacterized protein DUF2510